MGGCFKRKAFNKCNIVIAPALTINRLKWDSNIYIHVASRHFFTYCGCKTFAIKNCYKSTMHYMSKGLLSFLIMLT